MVSKGCVARSTPTTALVTDVKTMRHVLTKLVPMSATVREDSLENSARLKSPFVPHQNSAPAKMEVNVLITLLTTLVSVCQVSLE